MELEELYEKGKLAYAEHLNRLEEQAQEAETEYRKQLAKEQGIIRAALVEKIGSLVEFVDLEGIGLKSFQQSSRNYDWYGRFITIQLPNAAPIRMNLYYNYDDILVVTNVYKRYSQSAKGGEPIFEVPHTAYIDDGATDPTLVWDYRGNARAFSDLYLAVGCALANAHLEKEAWEQYNNQMKVSFDPGKPEPKTWRDTLAEAIKQAIEEATYG